MKVTTPRAPRPKGRLSLGVFAELLGDFRDDNARFGKRVAVDHRDTVGLEIHPLRHVEMAEGIAGSGIERELQMEGIAVGGAARDADNARAGGSVVMGIQAVDEP